MRVDDLATALRARDALQARVLYSELAQSDAAMIETPSLTDALDLAIAASITELIARRTRKVAPDWTRSVPTLAEPFALVSITLPSRFARLQLESPPELRARNLVAPENFLLSARD